MHLGNRRRGYCDRIEGTEKGVQPRAEFCLDQRLRLAAGEGREAVLQASQIDGELLAQQIGSGGQKLTELDKARPQFLEGSREALARTRLKRSLAAREKLAEPDEWPSRRNGPQRP